MPPYVYASGPALADMSQMANGNGYSLGLNIVAHAGGLQPLATPLTAGVNWVETVGTAGDSVCLPSAVGGQAITVVNNTATSMNVFSSNASTTDTINGTAGTTAFAVAANKTAEFYSKPGAWRAIVG